MAGTTDLGQVYPSLSCMLLAFGVVGQPGSMLLTILTGYPCIGSEHIAEVGKFCEAI